MSKYYTIHLSKTQNGVVDDSGTNVLGKKSFGDTETTVTWLLDDTAIANQFYYINDRAIKDPYRWCHWNFYNANQVANMHDLIDTLNEDIKRQGADANLLINYDDTMVVMHDKLNEVHYVFEKQLVDLQEDPDFVYTEEYHPEVEILERLNKTVHEIEANMDKWFRARDIEEKQYFIVIRHFSPDAEQYYEDLDDEGYAQFKPHYYTGDLYLDFYTVGKDLGHAYSTGDLELVKRGEIKPQKLITGSACIGLNGNTFRQYSDQADKNLYDMYYYWADGHNVEDHGINVRDPENNLGRAHLGDLQNETWESVIQKIEEYPFISNIKVWED
jgi:hypothetical protein